MNLDKLKWRDETSFSRHEADRTPKTWTLEAAPLKLVVHRHLHYPGSWLVSVRGMDSIDMRPLKAKDSEAAKVEAVGIVVAALRSALSRLNGGQE